MKLGVNIDHIATLRNARQDGYPDLLKAALVCKNAGANSITAHLREDRRHIKDQDIIDLKNNIDLPLNMEMAATEEMLKIACLVKPNFVCIVPEKRKEITTEGGLNVIKHEDYLKSFIKELQKHNILVSLFIEPSLKQVESSLACNANSIEIHTGSYANARNNSNNLKLIQQTANFAYNKGLSVHAGHGLNYQNIKEIVNIKEISEVNIGFSIIAKSIFTGLENAVKTMKELVTRT